MGSCLSLHNSSHSELEINPEQAGAGHSPISLLSNDILYLILLEVADAEPIYGVHGFASSRSKNPSYYDCLGWTRLSAVCRRWRAIVIDAASLWAKDVFDYPADMAALALTRSGTAPLTMVIPQFENTSPQWQRKVMNRKKWGLPHTHRERLLNLTFTHSHRIKGFLARDLSSQNYHAIFRGGSFDSLTLLALFYEYNDLGSSAPSREDLDDLHIVAPHVRKAAFSPTLPIACDGKPGLHIILPALRHLKISTDLKKQSTVPTSVDQLHWIPSLICGAPTLEHLDIDLFIDDLEVDWVQLFGGKCAHLSALRSLNVSGMPRVHLDQLFNLIASDVPTNVSITLVLRETDVLDTLEAYVSIIGRSIRLHSLDSVYLSRGLLTTSGSPTSSIHIEAYPSTELIYLQTTLEAYLSCPQAFSEKATQAGILMTALSPLPEPHEDPLDDSGNMLNLFIPILMHSGIKTLILDEITTGQWAIAVRGVIQYCLQSVTTLYCVNNILATPTKQPCTAALRLLYGTHTNEAHDRLSSGLQVTESHSYSATPSVTQEPSQFDQRSILPALETIVVSMIFDAQAVKGRALRSTGDIHKWWNEVVRALTFRQDIGLRVRRLRIIGHWTSEKLRKRTAKMDTKMLAQAGVLVDEVIDERSTLRIG